MNTQATRLAAGRNPWTVVACAALITTVSMGVRQSFGLFLRPISMDIGIGRETFGLAIAVQHLLFGLVQPFVGALSDRWGAGWIVVGGTLLYVGGLALAAMTSSALGLHVSLGLLVGLALSGTTFVVVLGAVGRVVSAEQRSLAFGITTAGGSLGQFLVVPGTQALLGEFGWRTALLLLAGLAGAMIALAAGVAGKPRDPAQDPIAQTLGETLREAASHRDYWLLNAGFFVCGFHVAFIATHLPAYLSDRGVPANIGAMTLALVGMFNIFGSYLFGLWGGRGRKASLLSMIYFSRTLLIAAFLALPLSSASALVFAAGMGFLWLGTIPLTSGIIGQVFGMRYLSTLYGIVFMSHQIGSFFGAWASGYVYDLSGSYDAAWAASLVLGLIAALVHLPIREAPLARLAPA